MTPAHTMKPKFSAAALKAMALEGRLSACEMRAFAARHAATLDADNHAAFVEAFLVQLGAPEQHARILELLATCGRDFHAAQGRIAYRPPGAAQLSRELIADGVSWRELLEDLELRLDLDLGSDDDSEDREYVRGLFEAEYAEKRVLRGGMTEPSAAAGRAGRPR